MSGDRTAVLAGPGAASPARSPAAVPHDIALLDAGHSGTPSGLSAALQQQAEEGGGEGEGEGEEGEDDYGDDDFASTGLLDPARTAVGAGEDEDGKEKDGRTEDGGEDGEEGEEGEEEEDGYGDDDFASTMTSVAGAGDEPLVPAPDSPTTHASPSTQSPPAPPQPAAPVAALASRGETPATHDDYADDDYADDFGTPHPPGTPAVVPPAGHASPPEVRAAASPVGAVAGTVAAPAVTHSRSLLATGGSVGASSVDEYGDDEFDD